MIRILEVFSLHFWLKVHVYAVVLSLDFFFFFERVSLCNTTLKQVLELAS